MNNAIKAMNKRIIQKGKVYFLLWFRACFQHSSEQHFREKFSGTLGHLSQPDRALCDDDLRSLMFGDYMTEKGNEKLYDEITDLAGVREVRINPFMLKSSCRKCCRDL